MEKLVAKGNMVLEVAPRGYGLLTEHLIWWSTRYPNEAIRIETEEIILAPNFNYPVNLGDRPLDSSRAG